MKKLIIQDEKYYYALVTIVGSLLMYNLYTALLSMNIFGLFPIAIQATLLFLLLNKSRYAKLGLRLWAGIALIGSAGLTILGLALRAMAKAMRNEGGIDLITSPKMMFSLILVIIGVIVFILTRELEIADDTVDN